MRGLLLKIDCGEDLCENCERVSPHGVQCLVFGESLKLKKTAPSVKSPLRCGACIKAEVGML